MQAKKGFSGEGKIRRLTEEKTGFWEIGPRNKGEKLSGVRENNTSSLDNKKNTS